MADLTVTTASGQESILKHALVEEFRDVLRGELLLRGDDGYDEARTVYNTMIDRFPGLIVRCAGTAERLPTINSMF